MRVKSFSKFSEEEQEFLQCYCWLRQWSELFKLKELFSVMEDNQAQEGSEKLLQSFEIKKDTIQRTDDTLCEKVATVILSDKREHKKRFAI